MIKIELPCLPPSLNHAYPSAGDTRFPSPALKKFKSEMKIHIAKEYPVEMARMKKDVPYALHIRFFFVSGKKGLYCGGWPKKAKNRYKGVDATNRVKILEDTLVAATAIDDSNNFVVSVEKLEGPAEKTIIFLWNLEEEESPHAALRRL